jgi:hypothetical protein
MNCFHGQKISQSGAQKSRAECNHLFCLRGWDFCGRCPGMPLMTVGEKILNSPDQWRPRQFKLRMPAHMFYFSMIKQPLLVLATIGIFCGCSRLSSAPGVAHGLPAQTGEDPAKAQLRSNAAGLLYDLLEQEKNVSKVFAVKDASKQVVNLVTLIAATALVEDKELTQLAAADSGLNIKSMALPPGETAARAAESKSEEYDLLFSSGANFEFNLLLSQAQAEDYGWHLAKVAAENSTLPSEKKTFTNISMQMEHLYEETVKQMRLLPPS